MSASYVTGSIFTGSNLATSASHAITASYALNAAGASPGGNQWNIQVNSGSGQFYGDDGFQYSPSNRIVTYTGNYNYNSNPLDQDAKSTVRYANSNNTVFAKQHYANIFHHAKEISTGGTTNIMTFDVGGGAVNTNLGVHGFKCDYCIGFGNLTNGSPEEVSDTRVGTLLAAWSWDWSTKNITDSHVISDAQGVLGDGIFQLTWASDKIILQYDCGPNIGNLCVFSGLFTVFSNK